jgi:hypothetical protein
MSREGSHAFYRAASGDLAVLHLVCEFVLGLTMRCSEPGMSVVVAIHASRAPGR